VVTVDVHSRPSGTLPWNFLTSSSSITLDGQASTYYHLSFTGGSRGTYDYRLDLRSAATGALLDSFGPDDDIDLRGHAEEPPSVDPAVYIYDARIVREFDSDGDGFVSEFDLEFDPDAEFGDHTVYAALYTRPSSGGRWTLITTTEDITISSTATVYYAIPLTGGSHGLYDFLLELYNAHTGRRVDSYGPNDDPALRAHAEETPSEDDLGQVSGGCACGAGVSSAFFMAIALRGYRWRRRRRKVNK
jgi:hypothetical protein